MTNVGSSRLIVPRKVRLSVAAHCVRMGVMTTVARLATAALDTRAFAKRPDDNAWIRFHVRSLEVAW